MSISFGCIVKSENKSSSGGNKDDGRLSSDLIFSSRMYCSMLPKSLKYSLKALAQYKASSLVKVIL